jgi:hypothetical protein
MDADVFAIILMVVFILFAAAVTWLGTAGLRR